MKNIYYLIAYFIICAICLFIMSNKQSRKEMKEKTGATGYNIFMFGIYFISPFLLVFDVIRMLLQLLTMLMLNLLGMLLTLVKKGLKYRVPAAISCIVLFLVLYILKQSQIINWSWWLVTLPLMIPIIFIMIILIILTVVAIKMRDNKE